MIHKELVTVMLIAENSDIKLIKDVLESIKNQIYKNIEIIIVSSLDADSYKKLYDELVDDRNIRIVNDEDSENALKKAIESAHGKFIFYKTVDNILWYNSHILSHVEIYNSDNRIKWVLSNIEYRDINKSNHALNVLGYRIDNNPETNKIIFDEISHCSELKINWSDGIVSNQFVPGVVINNISKLGNYGKTSNEITVAQWIDRNAKSEESINKIEDVYTKIGIPVNTEVKDVNVLIGDEIEVKRTLPTIMGNKYIDSVYNDKIRNVLNTTVPTSINDIAIKRTVGMGDVILVEPIIKKLKQKYYNSKITFYTSKPEIVEYFSNKPDSIVKINENQIINDFLSSTNHQVKFDLDLSYESRLRTPFIDAYSNVCNIEWFDFRDKYPSLRINEDKQIDVKNEINDKYVVFVSDGSGWIGKTWGSNECKKLVDSLNNLGYVVVEPGFTNFGPPSRWNKCDLNTLINLINGCEYYIGADNGPMHIARSLMKKCIIVAGAALPYYSNPNRENIYYVQNNNLSCLGCKHDQFVNLLQNGSLTFVANCVNDDKGVCMKQIKHTNVLNALNKMEQTVDTFIGTKAKYSFNIPGYSYYHDEKNDIYVRENVDEHPDQEKDISTEYDFRWNEVYEKYSKPFVNVVAEKIEHKKQRPICFDNDKLSLLDVGCNIGLVVKAANEIGFNAFGCDINVPSMEKCHKLFPELSNRVMHANMFLDNIVTKKEIVIPKSWDIISMNQTLEHISDPVKFLIEWKNRLDDDGLMFIGVPSFDEKDARMKMQKFHSLGTGEHVYMYTNKSFGLLMKKCELDFEYLQNTDDGIFAMCYKKKVE